jgi:hypothetical protein
MNRPVVIGGVITLAAAYWYYKRRVAAMQADSQNPNASVSNNIGSLINASNYQGMTGQTGDTYTNNYRYSEYKQYLSQGGTNSGSSFDQFLTAAQGQSLPMSN